MIAEMRSAIKHHLARFSFVKNETFQWVELTSPGCLSEHAHSVGITRIPAKANAGRTEIDVLGMIFTCQWWSD